MRYRRSMTVGGTRAPVDDGLAASGFGYERYTSLAGPLTRPSRGQPYRVQYRGIHRSRRGNGWRPGSSRWLVVAGRSGSSTG